MKKMLSYFNKFELILWFSGIITAILSFIVFKNTDYLNLINTLIGLTALLFLAKANPVGQILSIVFALIYGIISLSYNYYGEVITYVCMTGPIAVITLISWLKNLNGSKMEVKVKELKYTEYIFLFLLATVVTIIFYFILKAFDTPNLFFSTLSIFTSFTASYLTLRRSRFYAICYLANDIILIILWILASFSSTEYISVVICFIFFLINDLYGFINWTKLLKTQKIK